jgi:hypothetical protein
MVELYLHSPIYHLAWCLITHTNNFTYILYLTANTIDVSVTYKDNWLTHFKEMVTVYSENSMKYINITYGKMRSRDSVVGIATGYGLDD